MHRIQFYFILIAAAGISCIGLIFVSNAESQSAPADPNRKTVSQAASPQEAIDPNAPATEPVKEDNGDAESLIDEEEDNSHIPEFFDACDQIFSTYVNKNGMVRYADLRRTRADLLPVLRMMKDISPLHLMALSQDEKTAFWINTYNICVLQLIVENYPIQPKWYLIQYPDNSIMQISNPWTKNYFWVQGLQYNLKEIEQEILLDRTRDPRICFALSNASLGGGRLRPKAYRPATLNEQLDDQVRQYLASPFGCQIDRPGKVVHLSVLFQTKRKTFLESEYAAIKKFREYPDLQRTWLNFLVKYLPQEDAEFVANNPCTFKMITYDWHLDEGN